MELRSDPSHHCKRRCGIPKAQMNYCHPFANRSFQPRPKAAAARKHNLVTLIRTNREELSQPRKINVRPSPLAAQQNWLANLKAKEVVSATSSQAPTPSQPMDTQAPQCPTSPTPPSTEHTKYCAICTPLGKIYPIEFPMSSDKDKDDQEEEEKRSE